MGIFRGQVLKKIPISGTDALKAMNSSLTEVAAFFQIPAHPHLVSLERFFLGKICSRLVVMVTDLTPGTFDIAGLCMVVSLSPVPVRFTYRERVGSRLTMAVISLTSNESS